MAAATARAWKREEGGGRREEGRLLRPPPLAPAALRSFSAPSGRTSLRGVQHSHHEELQLSAAPANAACPAAPCSQDLAMRDVAKGAEPLFGPAKTYEELRR